MAKLRNYYLTIEHGFLTFRTKKEVLKLSYDLFAELGSAKQLKEEYEAFAKKLREGRRDNIAVMYYWCIEIWKRLGCNKVAVWEKENPYCVLSNYFEHIFERGNEDISIIVG